METLSAATSFTLLVDQKSVSLIFDVSHQNKIKNDKTQRQRSELSSFSFDLVWIRREYGSLSFSSFELRCVNYNPQNKRTSLFSYLDDTRRLHFVRSRNLPISKDEIKRTPSSCRMCMELKTQFFQVTIGPSNQYHKTL